MKGLVRAVYPLVTAAALVGTLAMISFWIPFKVKGIEDSYLILFVHFPSAVNGSLFFLIAMVAAIGYLATRRAGYDAHSSAAVEVGVLAMTVTLVTGSIWAKAAWGRWWVWDDPRLVTAAVMWLMYVGYLVLRSSIESPERRARFAAVFAIVSFVNVPLVMLAIRIFGAVRHPPRIESEPSMILTRWFGAGAFLMLYLCLWRADARWRQGEALLAEVRGKMEDGS